MNFLDCNINVKNEKRDVVERIASHTGYYLLRLEEDVKSYGPSGKPVHKTSYGLLEVFRDANGHLGGICNGLFLFDISQTITGYIDLGLEDHIYELKKK